MELTQNLKITEATGEDLNDICLSVFLSADTYISADSHPKLANSRNIYKAVNSNKYIGKNEISCWVNSLSAHCINKLFTSLTSLLSLSESTHIYRAHPCFNKTNGSHRKSEQPNLAFLNWKYETIVCFVASFVPQGSSNQIISLHRPTLFIALHIFQSQLSRHRSSSKTLGPLIFFQN